MPIVEQDPFTAHRLARGVCRALGAAGYAALTEFPLNSGRRVDVIAVNGAGETVIVEIKTSTADYRSDRKWSECSAMPSTSRCRRRFRSPCCHPNAAF